VDMEDFLERIRAIRPYLLASTEPPEKERLQSPEQQKKVDEVIRCILCACCTGSCPVMFENRQYVGPAALVWAFRYIFESRDEQRPERLRQVDTPDGVWSCVNHFECTRACPKQIPSPKPSTLLSGNWKNCARVRLDASWNWRNCANVQCMMDVVAPLDDETHSAVPLDGTATGFPAAGRDAGLPGDGGTPARNMGQVLLGIWEGRRPRRAPNAGLADPGP